MGGFSNTVGTSGNPVKIVQMAQAVATLRKNAKSLTAMNSTVFVLYPEQIYDLQVEGLSKTAGLAPALARENLLGIFGDKAGDNLMAAVCGTFLGIPVISHNLVPTANTGADSAGALFVTQAAMGCAMLWAARVEMQRNVSNRLTATTLFASMAYGVGELRDSLGVSIITDR